MMTEQGGRLQEIHIPVRKPKGVKKASSLAHQEARARANMYHFFSVIFLNPPQRDLLDLIAKKDFWEKLTSLFCHKKGEELKTFTTIACFDEDLEPLIQEYMDLFAVPTGRYTTPFEDVYWGIPMDGRLERGPLLGKRAIAALKIYREAGGELHEACKELPTHIGVELSFMSFLCEREAWAVQMEEKDSLFDRGKTQTKDSERYRQLQFKFLKAHLNQWFPQLNQSIQANAKNPFYRSLALITEAFLSQDAASLSGEPDSEKPTGYSSKDPQ